MDARYLRAVTVLPRQGRVCGRALLPFCLRHRVMLEMMESPFLDPHVSKFTPSDVIIAAKIISERDVGKMVEWTFRDHFEVFLMRHSRRRLARAVGTILGSISMTASYPKLWKKENDGNGSKYQKIPWVLSVISSLTRNGISLNEAWTMPEGEAVWISLANSIYDGAKVDVLSTQEEDEQANFDAIIAEFKEKILNKKECFKNG